MLDDEPYTVIGVMPREFRFPRSDTLLWTTLRFDERAYVDSERTNNWLNAVGRLRPGVTLEQARAEMETDCRAVAAAVSQGEQDTSASVIRFATRSRSGRGCCWSRSAGRPGACC